MANRVVVAVKDDDKVVNVAEADAEEVEVEEVKVEEVEVEVDNEESSVVVV